MRIAFRIPLFLIVIALAVSPVHAQSEGQADLYHYAPGQFAERVLRYTMVTTGSVAVTSGASSHTQAVDLHAELEIAFGSVRPDGSLPFAVRVLEASSSGLDTAGGSLAAQQLFGVLGRDGALASVETPKPLADLGLTFRELLAGLVVPAPASPISVGSQWSVRQANVEAHRVRSMTLTATYTAQGPKQWAGRSLPSVTARFSGQGSMREGTIVNQIEEIGHGLFYLQPQTGITDLSSVSLVTTVDTVQTGLPATRTRITLTTTLELREVREGGIGPAPAPPAEPIPGEPAAPAPFPAEEPQPAEAPPPESETIVEENLPAQVLTVYRDPAGRFSVGLPAAWNPEPREVALRRTRFERGNGAAHLYVAVMPLPSPAASAEAIARSTLATYQETLQGFSVIEQPSPATLDGEAASRAVYRYRTSDGRIATELALFARKGERAFYLQYSAFNRFDLRALNAEFDVLAAAFRFGPTPEGAVPAGALELATYADRQGGYSILIPTVWPLTDRSSDGSSATFTEVGENGYLSIYVQPGARGISPRQIVNAWKEQSTSDPGFLLLMDVTPSPLGSVEGVRVDYEWSGGGGRTWVRRLHGAVVDDVFYAVVLDYVKSGYEARSAVFDAMIGSFALLPPEPPEPPAGISEGPQESPAGEEPPSPATPAAPLEPASTAPVTAPTSGTPSTAQAPSSAPAQPAPASPAPVPSPAAASQEAPDGGIAVSTFAGAGASGGGRVPGYPFDEPVGSDSVLLLGRFIMRYPAANGRIIEEPGANLDVYVTAGGREYRTTTDPQGYFYIANLPRLIEGRFYTVERIQGTMLGVSQATVTFNHLETGVTSPRIAHLGKVILTRDATYDVDVQVLTAYSSSEDSALDRFVNAYPNSRWTEFVQEAIAVARAR